MAHIRWGQAPKWALLLGGLAISAAMTPVRAADDRMHVHVIDVGAGDAILVEFPCAAILVDTGGERTPSKGLPVIYESEPGLLAYLDKFFAARPDLKNTLASLVISHPHLDHTRSVQAVLDRYKPRNIVYNGQVSDKDSGVAGQRAAIKYANETPGVKTWFVLQRTIDAAKGLSNEIIDPVACQGVDPQIRAMWGQVEDKQGWLAEDFDDPNNHSVVLRIDYGKSSILLTGDLEESHKANRKAGIERMIDFYQGTSLLDVDVYKVGHHGSHNATSPALVSAMSPKIAAMSSGPACKRSGYTAYQHGHPRTETVNQLIAGVSGTRQPTTVLAFDKFEAPPSSVSLSKAVYSTGWDGTFVLSADRDGNWKVDSMLGAPACLKP